MSVTNKDLAAAKRFFDFSNALQFFAVFSGVLSNCGKETENSGCFRRENKGVMLIGRKGLAVPHGQPEQRSEPYRVLFRHSAMGGHLQRRR